MEQRFIAGPHCFMEAPPLVADLLDVKRYAKMWPRTPYEELLASSVRLQHLDVIGNPTHTAILMHRRRVSDASMNGETLVWVCTCRWVAQKGEQAHMPKFALATCLWLGRHLPMFRNADLAHQMFRKARTKLFPTHPAHGERLSYRLACRAPRLYLEMAIPAWHWQTSHRALTSCRILS